MAKKYTLTDVERLIAINNHIHFADILKQHHLKCCPFCKSTKWHYNKTNYICKSCDAAGDSVSYLMAYDLISYEKAIERLYNRTIKHD